MATGKRPSPAIPGARRKRPAPTIDLTATEVAAEPAAAPVQSEPLQAEAPPRAKAPPVPPHVPPSEPPRAASEPPPSGGIAWLPPDFPWPAAVAGALAAAAVLLVLLSIWLIVPRGGDAVAAALASRLASIEAQLRDLAARPAPTSIDPQALDALSARLVKLESALNAPRPVATDPNVLGRLGSMEGLIKPLSDSIIALARRADDTDAAFRNVRGRIDTTAATVSELQNAARASSGDHGEIVKLADRIAALEKVDRTVADQLAKNAAASAAAAVNDRPIRFALAASALRAAFDRGEPFTAELAAVKPLTANMQTLAAIEPFAASGVPSAATLGRELLTVLPIMQRAAGITPRDGGLLDRLQANAEKLVRVRPIEEMPGDDVNAILSRIEVKAAQADIAGALAELAKLPPTVRAPALAWVAKAEARGKAVDASRRLGAEALAALTLNP
ncbi:MAG: mitofilin family membrane protein [Xanthobacteraceae bacterium]